MVLTKRTDVFDEMFTNGMIEEKLNEFELEMENLELKAALKEEQTKNEILRSRLQKYDKSFREVLPRWYVCLFIGVLLIM